MRRSSPGGDGVALCTVPPSLGSASPEPCLQWQVPSPPSRGRCEWLRRAWYCSPFSHEGCPVLTGQSRGFCASGVCQGAARPCLPGFSAALQARKQGCTPCADQGRPSGSLPRAAPGVMCTSGNPGLQCPTGNICSLLLPWLSAPLLALPSPVPLARRCAQQLPILPASPKALFASSCLPHCLPWHYTCPQKPSAQPVSLGWAWKGAWLPSHAGSDQVQTAQSHPWGLMPICGIHRALGHRTGDALAVGPQYPLSLPAHPVSPFSHRVLR